MMKNPLERNKGQVLIPVLLGAAAAGALAYFLTSEDTAELREELYGTLAKVRNTVRDKAMEKVADLKAKASDDLEQS
jgi:hypothetical protein